jgi:hypothetical protein
MGHIRDLPASAAEIPAKAKGESWARLGVNVEDDFDPLYVIPDKKKKVVAELKEALKKADEVILATDEDREGESIGWHLRETLKPKQPVRRMVFHEITREAIAAALQDTRDIDMDLVRAQETRRILDRLVGYTVSPLLWRKIAPKLSAGPRAERRRAPAGAARAGAPRLCRRPVLGPEGAAQQAPRPAQPPLRGDAGQRGRQARRQRARLRRAHRARRRGEGRAAAQPAGGGDAAGAAAGRPLGCHRAGREGVHPRALRALHHLHPAAGGQPQTGAERQRDDARGAEPLRERLHHLHAHGLGQPERPGNQRRTPAHPRTLRRRLSQPVAAALPDQDRQRPGSPRGDPPRR